MPPAFQIEPGTVPDPNALPVTDLAEGAPGAARAAKPADKGKPDTAGIEQFLKAQIGSDRYKEVAPGPKPEDVPPSDTRERNPDGTFVKAGEKPKKPAKPAAKPAPFKPKPAAAATAPLSSEQIVAAAAEGAARALTASKPKEEPAPKKDDPTLTAEEKDTAEVLVKMEELNPTKYKGIADKYKSSLAALNAYAKKWEAEHPNEDFDEEAPEHEAFFKENDVNWSDLDFQKAIGKMMADESTKSVKDETDAKLSELERAERLRQRSNEIAAEQNTAAMIFWKELGDELADVVNPDGSLNAAKITQLREADPEAWNIRVSAAKALDLEVAEIYKLYNGLVKNDWEHNAIHKNVNQFAFQKEKELAAKPTQERLDAEGRMFVSAAEYFRMTKADRANHWTFSARDIAFMRSADLARTAQKRVEIAEEAHIRWAKARGIQLENPDEKPVSPASGGESRMAAVTEAGPKTAPSGAENFLQKQLRGS